MRSLQLGTPTTASTTWLVLVMGVILFAFAEYLGWFFPVVAMSEKLLVPIKVTSSKVVAQSVEAVEMVRSPATVSPEIHQLASGYSRALARISELEVVAKEYQDLARMCSVQSGKKSTTSVFAPISSYATPTLGIGSQSDIKPGFLLFDSGTFLGVVSQVTEQQAKVSLVQAGGLELVAQTESGVQGIIRGDGKNIHLREVPSSLTVATGERVVTAGQKGIPKGLLIGVVTQEDGAASAPTKSFEVNQLRSFFSTTLVEVVTQ